VAHGGLEHPSQVSGTLGTRESSQGLLSDVVEGCESALLPPQDQSLERCLDAGRVADVGAVTSAELLHETVTDVVRVSGTGHRAPPRIGDRVTTTPEPCW
jgi:hypothetical protein